MRKITAFILVATVAFIFGAVEIFAQDPTASTTVAADEGSVFQLLKQYFIQGDWRFMSLVLVTLILGLAFVIERIITLNIASVNTDKLVTRVDERLAAGDVDGAMEVCKSTSGPTASVLYEGIRNSKYGQDAVEKSDSIIWLSSNGLIRKRFGMDFIVHCPSSDVRFHGYSNRYDPTFDRIQEAGDLSPSIVAGGIKVALLTTVFGLVVAIILQIFYNYIVSKINSIVGGMEDASIALVDIMSRYNIFNR